jgi:hypothetical protein
MPPIAKLKNRRESCRDARFRQLWKEEIARPKKMSAYRFRGLPNA